MLTLIVALAVSQDVIEMSGVTGGFAVHVGCGEKPFLPGAGFQVHALDRDPANVEKARAAVRAKGAVGPPAPEEFRP